MKILCISKYTGLSVVKKPFYHIEVEMDFEYFYSLNKQAVNEFDLVIVDGEYLAENKILNLFFLKENSFKQLLILNMQKLKFNANHLDQGCITVVQSEDELATKLKELGVYEDQDTHFGDEFAVTQISNEVANVAGEETTTESEVTACPQVNKCLESIVVEDIHEVLVPQVSDGGNKKENKKPKFKMPQISVPTGLGLKKVKETSGDLVAPVGRTEYGFIGATNGVGTTFVALFYAQKLLLHNKKVAFMTSNKLERDQLKQVFKKINFFLFDDYDQQVYQNDCIVYDYGVLDLNSPARLREWERCQKRYIVVNLSPMKKYSVNAILQYLNQNSIGFEVVFDFVDDGDLKAVQSTFKELRCSNMPYTVLR